MNIIHLMVKKNHAANELEDHMKTHLANGCDVGFQYYNADSFNELCEYEKSVRARFLGTHVDGGTDQAQISQEAGVQRFVDLEIGEPVEYLMGIEALSNENADGVFEALKKLALKVGITEEDFEAKVSVATMDGASVNMGDRSSVKTRLIETASQMIIIHCCNHSLELVVAYAAKGHKDVEDAVATLEEVFKFYHYSPKKKRHLVQVSGIFEDLLTHFGGMSNIRWCASQQRS